MASGGTVEAIGSAPPGGREALAAAARDGFITGLNEIFLLSALVALAGGLLAFLLVRGRDFVVPGGAHEAPEERDESAEAEPAPAVV